MEEGGPFDFGDLPDDLGSGDVDPDPPPRGWLPPEDRLWRHPSEMRALSGPGDSREPSRTGFRWSALAVGVLGAAVVAGGAAALTSHGGGPLRATDTSLVTAPSTSSADITVGPDVVKVVDSAAPSLVALVPSGTPASTPPITGVVLPGGSLVLTAASAVDDGEQLTVVTARGHRHSGQVAGRDERSGVAVVRLDGALTSGSFVDQAVAPHQLAVAACRCGPGASTVPSKASPKGAVGMVRSVGTAATQDGGPALVDAIEAEMPLGPSASGSVLLDDDGGVLGILAGERTAGGDTFGYFVPAPLAVAVAEELARDHVVTKGWMGVVCADDGGTGTTVTAVLPGSPAAQAGIRPGDIVEAVDAHQVSSVADLQARLYMSPPGTELELSVVRAGSVEVMPITVVASPS